MRWVGNVALWRRGEERRGEKRKCLTLSLLMSQICVVSKTFGEWYQKTNKTEDTNKLTLLTFKIIAILHKQCVVSFRRTAKSDYSLRHVCLSVCLHKLLGSEWTGFYKIGHLRIFKKSRKGKFY
jgi:hypothetical protein